MQRQAQFELLCHTEPANQVPPLPHAHLSVLGRYLPKLSFAVKTFYHYWHSMLSYCIIFIFHLIFCLVRERKRIVTREYTYNIHFVWLISPPMSLKIPVFLLGITRQWFYPSLTHLQFVKIPDLILQKWKVINLKCFVNQCDYLQLLAM